MKESEVARMMKWQVQLKDSPDALRIRQMVHIRTQMFPVIADPELLRLGSIMRSILQCSGIKNAVLVSRSEQDVELSRLLWQAELHTYGSHNDFIPEGRIEKQACDALYLLYPWFPYEHDALILSLVTDVNTPSPVFCYKVIVTRINQPRLELSKVLLDGLLDLIT